METSRIGLQVKDKTAGFAGRSSLERRSYPLFPSHVDFFAAADRAGNFLEEPFDLGRLEREKGHDLVSRKSNRTYFRFIANNRISVISSMAYFTPSRPKPESLTPPYGMWSIR